MKSLRTFMIVLRGCIPRIAFGALLLLKCGNANGADTHPVERKGVSRVSIITSERLPYLAITPVGFHGQSRWPLILFLHGSDQRGTDLNLVKLNGPPKYALANPGFPFVVVAPQLPLGKTWNAAAVAGLVKQLVARFRIDPARVYLTGLSTGGYGTWSTALEFPERFAAIAPIAGGGNTLILKHAEGAQLSALQSLGVWAFHGGSDSVVDPNESQRMVGEWQGIGAPDVRITIFAGAPHDIWSRVYDDPAFYAWLLQHHR